MVSFGKDRMDVTTETGIGSDASSSFIAHNEILPLVILEQVHQVIQERNEMIYVSNSTASAI